MQSGKDPKPPPVLLVMGVSGSGKTTADGEPAVVTCSALKRSYRDRLRAGRPNVVVIYLDADIETVRTRLATREGHFFPPELLASQFRDLEPPATDEGIEQVRVRLDVPAAQIVQQLLDEHGDAWRAAT